ncbi:MAG: hypothetical protein AB8B66_05790 [Rickettsiaceae bacterium]
MHTIENKFFVEKTKYKVTNWSPYNQNLKNRGKIILYLSKGNIESSFVNKKPYEQGVYRTYILHRLFDWGAPIIPPPSHSVENQQNPTICHNKIVQYIKLKVLICIS